MTITVFNHTELYRVSPPLKDYLCMKQQNKPDTHKMDYINLKAFTDFVGEVACVEFLLFQSLGLTLLAELKYFLLKFILLEINI